MEFNKVIRGAKREMNDEESVKSILDAGFLCHVAFQHQGQTMMIPTAYGRKDEDIYLHGSTKNFMLNQILDGQTICISVTHLDGIVLAKSLFHTSVNYRSVVLFGKATLVEDENERIEGMKVISENIIKGRWDEVSLGTESQLKATMVIKFSIEKASAKKLAMSLAQSSKAGKAGTKATWSAARHPQRTSRHHMDSQRTLHQDLACA